MCFLAGASAGALGEVKISILKNPIANADNYGIGLKT